MYALMGGKPRRCVKDVNSFEDIKPWSVTIELCIYANGIIFSHDTLVSISAMNLLDLSRPYFDTYTSCYEKYVCILKFIYLSYKNAKSTPKIF